MANEISRVWSVVVFEVESAVEASLGTVVVTGLTPSAFTSGSLATDPTLLRHRPEQPTRQRMQWRTDIHRAHDGTEARVSIWGAPRQTFDYQLRFVSDADLREIQRTLYGQLASTLVLPLWHEPLTLDAEAAASGTTLSMSLTNADFVVGDRLLLVNETTDAYELVSVDTISGAVTVTSPLASTWPVGTSVYPCLLVTLADGSSTERSRVNAGETRATCTTLDRRALGGAGGAVPAFNSLPLLDESPSDTGPAVDAFRLEREEIDFGAKRRVFASQVAPEFGGPRTFRIGSTTQRQFWKAFLDTVRGRQGAFYWPSYRPDLELSAQPSQGASSLLITDSGDYVATRWPVAAMRSIMVRSADGVGQPFLVTNAVDNGNGTQTLTLGSSLTNTVLGSTVNRIELMPTARLGSDLVEFEHFSTFSRVTVNIETEETPA